MWEKLDGTLLKIIPRQVTEYEKAFGIQYRNKQEKNATILRNWLTFMLRHQIMLEERKAHYKRYTNEDEQKFVTKFRNKVQEETRIKYAQYTYQGRGETFKTIINSSAAIVTQNNDYYELQNIM